MGLTSGFCLILVFLSALALSRGDGNYNFQSLTIYLLIVGLGLSLFWRRKNRSLMRLQPHVFTNMLPLVVIFTSLQAGFAVQKIHKQGEIFSSIALCAAAFVFFLSLFFFPAIYKHVKVHKEFFIGLVLCLVLGFVTVLLAVPEPRIDVLVFQKEAAAALLAGQNPYAMTFTNVMGAGSSLYPGGTPTSYPYPPLSLLFGVLGNFLGDPRWVLLLCHLLSGYALYYFCKRHRVVRVEAFLIAVLFLQNPVAHLVVVKAWTEVTIVLALSLGLGHLYKLRGKKTALFWSGFAIALKQYMILWIPFVWLLFGKLKRNQWIWLFGTAAFTYGVFFVWNPRELWNDLVAFHAHTPFRKDGLTLSSFIVRHGGQPLAGYWSLLGLAVALGLWSWGLLRRFSAGQERLALALLGLGQVLLITLLLSKHAFTNYYYLLHFLMVAALAVTRATEVSSKSA